MLVFCLHFFVIYLLGNKRWKKQALAVLHRSLFRCHVCPVVVTQDNKIWDNQFNLETVLQDVVYWTCFFCLVGFSTLKTKTWQEISHCPDFRALLWQSNSIFKGKVKIFITLKWTQNSFTTADINVSYYVTVWICEANAWVGRWWLKISHPKIFCISNTNLCYLDLCEDLVLMMANQEGQICIIYMWQPSNSWPLKRR